MALEFDTLGDLARHGFDAVIDVRSPSEFAEDHLPGAMSLPVLSDAERARVGTIYVQESPFLARKIGAALVARNAAHHIETVLAGFDGGWRPLVYCWRGGQRSGSFASILSQIGWRADTVAGGYRTFRRLVVRALYDAPWPVPVVILDGNTGTAKTALLQRLEARGVQIVDLEGLAGHRGSVLGGMAGGQPSQKGFESGVAMALAGLDPDRPVVIEAESSKVGERLVPPSLWAAMLAAPRIVVEAPVAARAAYLAQAYADIAADPEALSGHLEKLVPYHGRAVVGEWQGLVAEGAHEALAASLIETHYDPRYAKSRARSEGEPLARLATERLDEAGLDGLADRLAEVISGA